LDVDKTPLTFTSSCKLVASSDRRPRLATMFLWRHRRTLAVLAIAGSGAVWGAQYAFKKLLEQQTVAADAARQRERCGYGVSAAAILLSWKLTDSA